MKVEELIEILKGKGIDDAGMKEALAALKSEIDNFLAGPEKEGAMSPEQEDAKMNEVFGL